MALVLGHSARGTAERSWQRSYFMGRTAQLVRSNRQSTSALGVANTLVHGRRVPDGNFRTT